MPINTDVVLSIPSEARDANKYRCSVEHPEWSVRFQDTGIIG
ncbi:MAG: hypothetical protein ABIL69_10995 [candidate division WOR-3 bacterium]